MNVGALTAIAIVLLVLTGCGEKKSAHVRVPPAPEVSAPPSTSPPSTAVPKSPNPVYVETGLASWYGPPYHNRRGSNGEVYDMNALTAAHRTLPLNTVARVTNLTTGHSATVRITDRGPFIEGRMVDLSLAAAKQVDVWRAGTARVKLEVLQAPSPINQGGRWCVQIGAFNSKAEARKLSDKLRRQYHNAQVLQFTGPTGEWVRIRVAEDDKRRAEQLAHDTRASQGAVFLVRLD